MTRIEAQNTSGRIEGSRASAVAPESPIQIPDSVVLGDPVASALATIAEFANETRAFNRELQQIAEKRRLYAEQQEIAHLRERADAIRTGAWFAAGTLALSAGAHACAFAAAGNAGDAATNAGSTTGSLDCRWVKVFSASGDLFSKGSDLVTRFSSATEVGHETDAKAAASRARTHETDAQNHRDEVRAAQQIVERAYDAVRRVSQLKHDTELAIWRMHG